jgi:glutamate formiminotransferase
MENKPATKYTKAELAAIRREVEHEEEIEALREEEQWEPDYAADPSGQS